MARIFITGSAEGLGQLSAQWLIKHGQRVVLHARNEIRGKEALMRTPGAEAIITADLIIQASSPFRDDAFFILITIVLLKDRYESSYSYKVQNHLR
jgi:NAD(P)-dependent dehydrogenase (short-subunit alcohol dehydrogenase family)